MNQTYNPLIFIGDVHCFLYHGVHDTRYDNIHFHDVRFDNTVPVGKLLPLAVAYIDKLEAELADNKPMVLAANKQLPVIDDVDDSIRLGLLPKSTSTY